MFDPSSYNPNIRIFNRSGENITVELVEHSAKVFSENYGNGMYHTLTQVPAEPVANSGGVVTILNGNADCVKIPDTINWNLDYPLATALAYKNIRVKFSISFDKNTDYPCTWLYEGGPGKSDVIVTEQKKVCALSNVNPAKYPDIFLQPKQKNEKNIFDDPEVMVYLKQSMADFAKEENVSPELLEQMLMQRLSQGTQDCEDDSYEGC
jgi:hypothetical protein